MIQDILFFKRTIVKGFNINRKRKYCLCLLMVKLNCLRHGEGVFFFTWGHDVLITGPELFDAEVGPLVRTLEGAATVPIKPSCPGTHVSDSLKSHFFLRPFLPNTVLWHCGHTGPSARP